MPSAECGVSGCGEKIKCKGFCPKHYMRWRRHGDPLAGFRSPGEAKKWLEDRVGHTGNQCLIYPFCRTSKGYGTFQLNGKMVLAHRYICEKVNGAPPSAKHVAAHSCGNGHLGCVNPRHIRWATHSENHLESVAHGTHQGLKNIGSKHPCAKLTEDDVVKIRGMVGLGSSQAEVCREMGLLSCVVSRIVNRKSWRHVK